MAINKQYLKLQLFLHMTYEGTTSNSHRNQSYCSIFILIPQKFQVWSKEYDFEKRKKNLVCLFTTNGLFLVIKNAKINFFEMKLKNFKMKLKNFKISKFEKYRQNAKILSY